MPLLVKYIFKKCLDATNNLFILIHFNLLFIYFPYFASMKIALTVILFSLLLQCKNSSNVNSGNNTDVEIIIDMEMSDENEWWRDTTSTAATAKAGEFELEDYRTIWIDYDLVFNFLKSAPVQGDTAKYDRVLLNVPLPEATEKFAMYHVPVMSPELAEKYPQIRTYEGRSITDPTTSIRLDFGENGANYMVLKAGEQIFLQPVTQGNREIYIIYNKKDVKKHPIDFEKPTR